MKICFIGPANSSHIEKWSMWFTNHGHEVHVISFTDGKISNVIVHLVDVGVDTKGSDVSKLKYLTTGRKISKLVNQIKPDIVNVHYATSYGATVAFSRLKGYVLSVWGSDIYSFPRKSIFHKFLLKYSLKRAKYLFSTSNAMAKEASKYTNKTFTITPFGVDMELFNPINRNREVSDDRFIVGTVKALVDIYGIEYLIRAVKKVTEKRSDINIVARIAGDGKNSDDYLKLVKELEIENRVEFLGRITQKEASLEWANMDVAIIPSIVNESFGVAAIEAEASGIPVIVTNMGGLVESTCPGTSSIVVDSCDAEAIASAIISFYDDSELRSRMGIEGRKYVEKHYELNNCFNEIENEYKKIIYL